MAAFRAAATIVMSLGAADAVDTAWMPPIDPVDHKTDPRCACKYRDAGEIPASTIGADGAKFPLMKYYGTSCSLWDQMKGTPFYDSCAPGSDLCKDSWCQGSWCFVDESCPGAVESKSAWRAAGSTKLFFSYLSCGAIDCFGGTAGCPFDPEKRCETDPCACKFQGGTLPESYYKDGTSATSPMIHLYGTSCSAWDAMPGSPFYSSCDVNNGADVCKDSWCLEKWCYVGSACPSANKLVDSIYGAPTEYFSYTACGNPDCYFGTNGCPYDDPRDQTTCGTTCGGLKEYYKNNTCCNKPEQRVARP